MEQKAKNATKEKEIQDHFGAKDRQIAEALYISSELKAQNKAT